MKKAFYTFLYVFVFGLMLAQTSTAKAQDSSLQVEYPVLGISDVLMKEYMYTPGKDIEAQMLVNNIVDTPTEFKYRVDLYPANKNMLDSKAQTLLHTSSASKTELLSPKENKTISIIHTVPSYVSGPLTLSVLAFNDQGTIIGRKDLFLLERGATGTLDSQLDAASNSKSQGVMIRKITFTQDGISYEPNFGDSAYLIDGKNDLSLTVSTEGTVKDDVLISVDFKNIHTQQIKNNIYQAIESDNGQKDISLMLNKNTLDPGIYEVLISPVNIKKEQVGPSKKVQIGVAGEVGVIHAFHAQKKSKDTSAGNFFEKNKYLVVVDWTPVYQISKIFSDENKKLVFTGRLTLQDETSKVISSTTISNIETPFAVDVTLKDTPKEIWGTVEILYENNVIVSYKKKLIEEMGEKSGGFGVYLLVVAFLVALFVGYNRFFRKNKKAVFLACIALTAVSPNVSLAAWTLKSTTSFDNNYPKVTDVSATQWYKQTLPNRPWTNVVGYSRSCTKKTNLTGPSSNYVAQTLPVLSSDEKMYPFENAWYHIPVGGWTWYQSNKTRNGVWPTISTVITNVFTSSSFIHAGALARSASLTDNLNVDVPVWGEHRPYRLNATNGMGTNQTFALATTTFSNLSNWLNVSFNTFAAKSMTTNVSEKGFIATKGVVHLNPYEMFKGATEAVHLDSINVDSNYAQFAPRSTTYMQFPNNIDNYPLLKNALGIGTTTLSVWIDAAGFGSQKRYNITNDKILSDVPFVNSRPGTYKLFNFLMTFRDEANGDSKIATEKYDCISANMKVYEADYEIVPNSYVEVVMFYDKDEDGTFDVGEKLLASRTGERTIIDGGYPLSPAYSPSATNCTVSDSNEWLLNGIPSLQGTSSNPIAVLTSPTARSEPHNTQTRVSAYIQTGSQVFNPLFFPKRDYYNTPPVGLFQDAYLLFGNESTEALYFDTPSLWALASFNPGYSQRNGKMLYTSSGKLTMFSGSSVCGHTVIGSNSGMQNTDPGGYGYNSYGSTFGEDYTYLRDLEINNYPAPSSIVNTKTPYYKFPVNWALSRTYEVGVDETFLPSGWTKTTNPVTIDLGPTAIGNQHLPASGPVMLGVKLTANGQCGSAETTYGLSTTTPTTNLCRVGDNTPVQSNPQNFTWTCNGYGLASVPDSCTKPKCGGTNSHYCGVTNSCVADETSCNVAGVCGSATSFTGQTTASSTPVAPTGSGLCSIGNLNGLVAGQSDPVGEFTWACNGPNGGGLSPTCTQPKCSTGAGLTYCATTESCQTTCPEIASSTLIFDAKLTPRVVRKSTDQCILSWSTSSSVALPVSCTLNGVPLQGGRPSATIERSTGIPVGTHTLSCTNSEQNQSTTVKCLLNPNFREI